MTVKLLILGPEGAREIMAGSPVVVGRAPSCEILADSDGVAHQQARLMPMAEGLKIEHIGNLSPTRVNGQPVTEQFLKAGDSVQIGALNIIVGASAQTLPNTGAVDTSRMPREGDSFAKFTLKKNLGSDNMGTTFIAHLKDGAGAPMALKILSEKLSNDPDFVENFLDVAPRARELKHPYLVPFKEFGRWNTRLYFVMDFVNGDRVADLVKNGSPMAVDEVVDITLNTCKALAHAASRGLCHQDIRPKNILVMPDGKIRVVGLGLASLATGTLARTNGEVTMGDPLYMAPEQHAGEPLDVRTDMYSLGVTMFHMLTGRPPFEGQPDKVARMHREAQRPNAREANPDVPSKLAKLITHMMAVSPGGRPANPLDLVEALSEIKISLHVPAHKKAAKGKRSGSRNAQAVEMDLNSLIKEAAGGASSSAKTSVAAAAARARSTSTGEKYYTDQIDKSPSLVIARALIALVLIGFGVTYFLYSADKPERKAPKPSAVTAIRSDSDILDTPAAREAAPVSTPASASGGSGGSSMAGAAPMKSADPAYVEVREKFSMPVAGEEGVKQRFEKLDEILAAGNLQAKNAAADIMAEMGEQGAAQLASAIATAPKEKLPWLVTAAKRIGTPELNAAMAARARKDGAEADYSLQLALAERGSDAGHALFVEWARMNDETLAMMGYRGLSQCARAGDLRLLLEAVATLKPEIGQLAIAGLRRATAHPGATEGLSDLMRTLLDKSEGGRRELILQAISEMPSDISSGLLIGAMGDPSPRVRAIVARGLGMHKETVPQAVTMLETNKEEEVKRASLEAFKQRPNFMAIPAVMKILLTDQGNLRDQAREVLIASFGVNRGNHSKSWDLWLRHGERQGDPGRYKVFVAHQESREAERSKALRAKLDLALGAAR